MSQARIPGLFCAVLRLHIGCRDDVEYLDTLYTYKHDKAGAEAAQYSCPPSAIGSDQCMGILYIQCHLQFVKGITRYGPIKMCSVRNPKDIIMLQLFTLNHALFNTIVWQMATLNYCR